MVHDLAVQLSPSVSRGRRTTIHQVRLDRGNALERHRLSVSDAEGALTLRTGRSTTVEQPRAAGTLDVPVSVKARHASAAPRPSHPGEDRRITAARGRNPPHRAPAAHLATGGRRARPARRWASPRRCSWRTRPDRRGRAHGRTPRRRHRPQNRRLSQPRAGADHHDTSPHTSNPPPATACGNPNNLRFASAGTAGFQLFARCTSDAGAGHRNRCPPRWRGAATRASASSARKVRARTRRTTSSSTGEATPEQYEDHAGEAAPPTDPAAAC